MAIGQLRAADQREDKLGSIDHGVAGILNRLDIEVDEEPWMYMTQNFESSFKTLVGAVHSLKQACKEMGYQRMLGAFVV